MFDREIASTSCGGRTAASSTGPPPGHGHRSFTRPRRWSSGRTGRTLPSGTTAVSASIVLSLAAVFSPDVSSGDTDGTGAGPVRAHVRPMDAWSDLVWKRSSTVQLTGLWTFGRIGKLDEAPEGSDVDLPGLFAERALSWALPAVAVAGHVAGSDRSMRFNGGVGRARHFAGNNYSMLANYSRYIDPVRNRYGSGTMLALGYSTEVGVRRDILYANGYWAAGDFMRLAGSGPLPPGPIGLSFSRAGLGDNRPVLRSRPLDTAGFAVGVQTFFADETANWAVELGRRQDLDRDQSGPGSTGGTALTTRAQYKFAKRFLLQLDAYYALDGRDSKSHRQPDADGKDPSALRVALKVSF